MPGEAICWAVVAQNASQASSFDPLGIASPVPHSKIVPLSAPTLFRLTTPLIISGRISCITRRGEIFKGSTALS